MLGGNDEKGMDGNEMTTEEKIKRAEALADVLMLRPDKVNGRYPTTWGDKTALGLYETVKRIIEDGE